MIDRPSRRAATRSAWDRTARLFDKVAGWCSAWAVGEASQAECDGLGMAEAQRLAARRALEALSVVPDAVVVDGLWDFVRAGVRTERMVKADMRCLSVAAASILMPGPMEVVADMAFTYVPLADDGLAFITADRKAVALA